MDEVLTVRQLTTGYDDVVVLDGLDLDVAAGEVVAMLGPNGAGKTTLLRALSGQLPISKGQVVFKGEEQHRGLHHRARRGLGYIGDDKSIFPGLTTKENLKLARGDSAAVLAMFPELGSRLAIRAGLLSGGEQQMLAVGRALGRKPDLVMADELSMGLAPLIVKRILKTLRAAADSGVGVLIVEQYVDDVLAIADSVYVLGRGRVEFSGSAAEFSSKRQLIEDSYFATARQPNDNGSTESVLSDRTVDGRGRPNHFM